MKNKYILTITLLSFLLLFTQSLQAAVIYVDANQTTGNQDGTSWENAFSDLQSALQSSTYDDEIWVSQGTYFPTSGTIRNFFFLLVNGVKMYGGFTGEEENLEDRNWESNTTILSGDIGIQGDDSDNSYTVVFCNTADSTTTLDGFTITGGNANGTSGQGADKTKSGGGLYLYRNSPSEDASPIIKNCSFISNNALVRGGAVFMQNTAMGGASPEFINCLFEDNSAGSGGAIDIKGSSKFKSIEIKNCEVGSNSSTFGGGICFFDDFGVNDVVVDSCAFSSNYALAAGGAIYLEKYSMESKLEVLNSSFEFNQSSGEGMAIADLNLATAPGIHINNCFFNGNNQITNNGNGVISFYDESYGLIRNCTFTNSSENTLCIAALISNIEVNNSLFHNLSTIDRPSVARSEEGNLSVTNCTITQNSSESSALFFIPYGNEGLTINNCLIYNNDVPFAVETIQNTPFNISHSLIDVDSCQAMTNGPVNCGPGMLYSIDPLFVDTTGNDYRLQPCSPARNVGDNNFVTQQNLLTDLQGNERILEDVVDMGAYETLPYDLQLNESTDLLCNEDSSGTIYLEVQSGCGSITLFLDQDSITSGTSPFFIDQLSAGSYAFTTTDAEGRTDDLIVEIEEPTALNVLVEGTTLICPNSSDGMVSAIVDGGTSPYAFEWETGEVDSLLTDLEAGTYLLTVTDGNECTAEQAVTIENNSIVTLTFDITAATGANNSDGNIFISQIIGGVAPYELSWSTGDTTTFLVNLLPDNYFLTIIDALGCLYSYTVVVGFEVGINEEEKDIDLRVYPNPISPRQEFWLEYGEGNSNPLTIELLDVFGKTLWYENLEVLEGNNRRSFIAPDVKGAYVLLICEEGSSNCTIRKLLVR